MRSLIGDVLIPLRFLHAHGPSSMGMWAGADKSDACRELSGVPSSFWAVHEDECESLLYRHFITCCLGTGACASAILLFMIIFRTLARSPRAIPPAIPDRACQPVNVVLFVPDGRKKRWEDPRHRPVSFRRKLANCPAENKT